MSDGVGDDQVRLEVQLGASEQLERGVYEVVFLSRAAQALELAVLGLQECFGEEPEELRRAELLLVLTLGLLKQFHGC